VFITQFINTLVTNAKLKTVYNRAGNYKQHPSRSEGALGFLGKNDRSRKFGEEIFEGDIIVFAREILPAKLREGILAAFFFCKRNLSPKITGRNFGGFFL
jgi:hypothetical protein